MKKNIKIPWAKPFIDDEEKNQILDVLDSGWLTTGEKVKALESGLAKYLDIKHAIAVSNGTDAIDIVLKTLGIIQDDEVIIPAHSYISTASAITYQNAIPVFVDIDPITQNILPEKIIEAVTDKTKAIMYIDYGGNPADYDKIKSIGKAKGIPIILDGAHSIGTIYKGSSTISKNEISTISFHMAKVLTTVEGGMIFTSNDEWNREIRIRINQGESGKGQYDHILLGTNARMTDLQAAIGLGQLKKLDNMLRLRSEIAKKYDDYFLQYSDIMKVSMAKHKNSTNSYFLYPIQLNNRNVIATNLIEKYGIDTRIAWPKPIYEQTLYKSKKYQFKKFDCTNAEIVCSKVLNLPMYPSMDDNEIAYVATSLIKELIDGK